MRPRADVQVEEQPASSSLRLDTATPAAHRQRGQVPQRPHDTILRNDSGSLWTAQAYLAHNSNMTSQGPLPQKAVFWVSTQDGLKVLCIVHCDEGSAFWSCAMSLGSNPGLSDL